MKKVLVIGAAGTIGIHTIKYLLSEGMYEITVVDLKSKNNIQRLKRFRKRVNIVYGDVADRVLIEALIKDHDYCLFLATVLPPLADIKKELSMTVEYDGVENICRAITYYNPKCHLFYASTTSMYKGINSPSVKSKIKLDNDAYFDNTKYKTEMLIKRKIKNYTIYRIPLVLTNPLEDEFMYHGKNDDIMDVITKEDCAYAFIKGIKYAKELNKKTFNLASQESIKYQELLNKLLSICGLSFKYVFNRLLIDKTYISPVCSDRDELDNIIHYRNDSLNEYYGRLRRAIKKRKIRKFMAKPFIKK